MPHQVFHCMRPFYQVKKRHWISPVRIAKHVYNSPKRWEKNILRKEVWDINIITAQYTLGYSAPSTSAAMTSGHLLHNIIAFPLISVRDRRLKSWLVGSLSSHPFFLARACPIRLTTPVATLWKPPRVSTARGKNCSPWVLQASAVSLIFLS